MNASFERSSRASMHRVVAALSFASRPKTPDEYVLLEPGGNGNVFRVSVFVKKDSPIARFHLQLDPTRETDLVKWIEPFVDVSAVKYFFVNPMTPRRRTEFDIEKLAEVVVQVQFMQAVLWLK